MTTSTRSRSSRVFNDGEVEIPLAYIRGQKFDLALNRLTPADVRGEGLRSHAHSVPGRRHRHGDWQGSRAVFGQPRQVHPRQHGGAGRLRSGRRSTAGSWSTAALPTTCPVSVARDMGAEVFIVVDVGSGLYKRDQTQQRAGRHRATRKLPLHAQHRAAVDDRSGPRDVLIRPALGDIGGDSFDRAAEAIPIGESAARAAYRILADATHSARRTTPGTWLPACSRPSKTSRSSSSCASNNRSPPGRRGHRRPYLRQARPAARCGSSSRRTSATSTGSKPSSRCATTSCDENGKTGLVVNATEKYWGPGVPTVRHVSGPMT